MIEEDISIGRIAHITRCVVRHPQSPLTGYGSQLVVYTNLQLSSDAGKLRALQAAVHAAAKRKQIASWRIEYAS